jgi:hypothetical protein
MVSRAGLFFSLGIVALGGMASLRAQAVKVKPLPDGFCLEPPLVLERSLMTERSAIRQATPANPRGIAVPVWRPGDWFHVALSILSVRPAASSGCSAPSQVTVVETVPVGWIPSMISHHGIHDPMTGTLTWELGPEALIQGDTLEYQVMSADTADTTFRGTVAEGMPPSSLTAIAGEATIERDSAFADCGAIRAWNVLGPFASEAGFATAPEALGADYLTDGVTGERDFAWFPGAWIETDYGGASAATALLPNANGWNPLEVPTAAGWSDLDGAIDLNDVYGSGPAAMAYAQTHVVNETGGPLAAILRVAVDGAGEVLLNGEVVLSTTLAPGRQVCGPLDGLTRPVVLAPGDNSLLVKVFAGPGGFGFALRFEGEAAALLTGGLRAEHRPAGSPCADPPVAVTRTIAAPLATVECRALTPAYTPGGSYRVQLILVRSMTASGCPDSADLFEKLPPGWTAADISGGGVFAAGMITWRLAPPFPSLLTYTAKVGGQGGDALFTGAVEEPFSRTRHPVRKDLRLSGLFSEQGFVRRWLLLGPYRQPPGPSAMPGLPALRADYLTDGGSTIEAAVEPREGDTVDTAYAPLGPARSVGLAAPATPGACSDVSIPTWKEWRDHDDTIDFGDFYGGNLDRVMMYAVTYIEVTADTVADIGLASSDSVQVLLDGEEIHIRNVARSPGPAGEVQDLIRASGVPALSPLTRGVHRLMVKVFEGGGEHGFRLRFQDPATGDPITEGLEICSDYTACGTVTVTLLFRRGDVDGSRSYNITDSIRILNFLFSGGPRPTCPDTADADDNGRLEVTDAVRGLCWFAFGSCGIAPPGPVTCGPDPTPDNLGPCAYDC